MMARGTDDRLIDRRTDKMVRWKKLMLLSHTLTMKLLFSKFG